MCPDVNFRVVSQSAKRIENFLPLNDCVPAQICCSVAYKVTCSSCQATYFSKTSRHFIVRCREYLGINEKGLNIKGACSSIRNHINETGHAVSLDDFAF